MLSCSSKMPHVSMIRAAMCLETCSTAVGPEQRVPLTSVAYEGLRHRQPGVFREALRQLDPVAVVADFLIRRSL